MTGKKVRWTKEMNEYLIANVGPKTSVEIGEHLGLNCQAVRRQAKVLGLKWTRTGCFVKGDKRMFIPPKGYRPSPNTEFKKGHKSINEKYDGCIVSRVHKRDNKPYKYIRTSKAKWMLYHRWIWQQANGLIPSSHVVSFKDGDVQNCELDNLILLSKQQNIDRNRNYDITDNLALSCLARQDKEVKEQLRNETELIQAKKLKLQLNRNINGIQREIKRQA